MVCVPPAVSTRPRARLLGFSQAGRTERSPSASLNLDNVGVSFYRCQEHAAFRVLLGSDNTTVARIRWRGKGIVRL